MYNPVSTYRFQLNEDFTFNDLDELLPYLQTLGVTTVYASPVFAATPGSVHGYDDVDPTRLNPEIGTYAQLRAISDQLRQMGMGWLQDIVPNHMAFHADNEWLMDVLEKGPFSRFAPYFDTALSSSFFHGRIMAPFLPGPLDESIDEGELILAYEQNRLAFTVNGTRLPLRPEAYATVLLASPNDPNDAIRQLLDQIEQLRHDTDPERYAPAWNELKQQLAALMKNRIVSQYVDSCLTAVNDARDLLRRLADDQHYRLSTEPDSRREMNYRRFFAVNSLICLNMRDETVFRHDHELIKNFVDEGIFQGLRVDHVDGLFDPDQYLSQLRALTGDDTYIVVEKILQADESLLPAWASDPVKLAGTSGYDFLAMVNNLLTNGGNEMVFRDFYQSLTKTDTPLRSRIRDRKAYFLTNYMGGELDNLHQYVLNLNLVDEETLATLRPGSLSLAIGELLVQCPVYRYYGNQMPLPAKEAQSVQAMIDAIRLAKPDLTAALDVIQEVLLTRPRTNDTEFNDRALLFYQRLMQFTGPLMAKGVEDTLLYTYTCFIGHNEVGDSPERFGMTPAAFHTAMQDRQTNWPMAQNTTATHDTKRGEDVRARLNVLTDLADEWLDEVRSWQAMNKSARPTGDETPDAPDLNDEYFIYQNLLGAYPMPRVDSPRVDSPDESTDDFPTRFHSYLEKALEEAKRHTDEWEVDETYLEGVRTFTNQLLDQQGPFWARFQPFHRRIADLGITHSLTQVLLKFTCPGIPDIYQGGEGWDLSFVDPDNRRPVDFALRRTWLDTLTHRQQSGDETIWEDLWQNRFDGRVKFWLTHTLLQHRRHDIDLFASGAYIPLAVDGAYRDHVVAFMRQHESSQYIIVVPLHPAQLCRQQQVDDVLALDWKDTRIVLPANIPSTWINCLTAERSTGTSRLAVKAIFKRLPLGLLRS